MKPCPKCGRRPSERQLTWHVFCSDPIHDRADRVDELVEALRKIVKETPFTPETGGISLLMSIRQLEETRTLLASIDGGKEKR